MSERLPSSESEFQVLMEKVDAGLRAEGASIPARPLRAFGKLCRMFKMSVASPLPKRAPTGGRYNGTDLLLRADHWYHERYGDALKMDFSPGAIVVLIRGDPWVIDFPLFYGSREIICSPTKHSDEVPHGFTSGKIYKFNALEAIRGLPGGLRASLRSEECDEILAAFLLGGHAYHDVLEVRSLQYVSEVLSDLRASVTHLDQQRRHEGQSRWASLQAAEKAYKAYLATRKLPIPRTHDLTELAALAASNGLPPTPKALIAAANCPAGVRYGEIGSNMTDAVRAHHAAFSICGGIARFLRQSEHAKRQALL